MHVLVVTIVHTPLDARIHHRQIRALRADGIEVTYAAPWSDSETSTSMVAEGTGTIDLPRASGRRRLRALRAARRMLACTGDDHDLILLHDPELLLAVMGQIGRLPPVVFDVHEDAAASLIDRPWVSGPLRPAAGWMLRRLERWAERRVHLLLAEVSYQARFRRPHPFVPNVPPRPATIPPEPGDQRVVYLGRIARSRGALEVLDAAAALRDEFRFELIGAADSDIEGLVRDAVTAGHVNWDGFVPNAEALLRIEGAMAGLSLVHPQPNHAGSLQTKVLEYLSRRVPVVSTDLPVTGSFIREHQVGVTVAPGDVGAVIIALRMLRDRADERLEMADRGFALVRDELNWERAGRDFVRHLRAIATERTSRGHR